MKINETEVCLDFHIYAILEFDILIGHPLENLIQEKPSRGDLDEKLGITIFATHLEIPMLEHLPNQDLFEEAKFISLFVSPKLACETEHIPSPSLEPMSCPSGHPNFVLDGDQDSTLILHENFCAMDILETPTLEAKRRDSINRHESFTFETPHISCLFSKSLEFIVLSTVYSDEDHNHLLILVYC
jgi:hypothetical protein